MTGSGKLSDRLKGHEPPFWGLLAFCLFSPISIAAANMAWVATLLLWLFHAFSQREKGLPPFQRTALDRGFALFVLASLMSLCVSLAPAASLLEFRSLGLIVVFYLFAWNAKGVDRKKTLIACYLGSATLAAAYGILEYVSGRDIFGHYDPTSNKIGGFFSMHLTFSEYLVLALCVLTGILGWARPGRKVLVLGLAACLLMGFGIFLSGAKASFLGMAAGWLVIFGLKGRKRLAGFLAALAIFLLVLSVWRSGYYLDYLISLYVVDATKTAGAADSNTQRLYMWWTGLRISPGHFLNGVGLHAVDVIYPAFRHVLARDPTQWHLHNNFMQLGVTRGLFGLTAFLFVFFLALRNGYQRFKGCSDPWEKGLTAGVLGSLPAFLVCGITEYSWGDSEVLMALYMLMGLAVSAPSKDLCRSAGGSPARAGEKPSITKTIMFCLLVVFLLFLAVFTRPAAVNMGSGILGVVVGMAMLLLVICRIVPVWFSRKTRPPGGVPLPAAESTSREGRSGLAPSIKPFESPWFSQMVACVFVFSGTSFTRGIWTGGDDFLAVMQGSSITVSSIFLANLVFVSLYAWHAKNRAGDTLFDVALFTAALLWLFIAMGTNLLLSFAAGTGGLFDPPFLLLLPLCTVTVLLYGLARFLYVGERVQDLFMAALCLALILHALFQPAT